MFLSVPSTRLVLISSAFLFLVSCAEEEQVPTGAITPAAEAPKATTQVPSTEDSFAADYFKTAILENPQPNSYEVLVTWAPFQGALRIFAEGHLVGMASGGQSALTFPTAGGRHLQLTIEAKRDTQAAFETVPVSVQIPSDFVIGKDWTLSENTKIDVNRVFLLSGVTITTLNFNLDITAKKFSADRIVIRNFPADAKAPRERNGRDGGGISLLAEQAQGRLSVILSGEDGGDGKKGAVRPMIPNSSTCVGTSGGNGGNSGGLVVKIKDGADLSVEVAKRVGQGGLGGLKGLASENPDDLVNFPCDINAPNGVNGKSGSLSESCVKRFADQALECR